MQFQSPTVQELELLESELGLGSGPELKAEPVAAGAAAEEAGVDEPPVWTLVTLIAAKTPPETKAEATSALSPKPELGPPAGVVATVVCWVAL